MNTNQPLITLDTSRACSGEGQDNPYLPLLPIPKDDENCWDPASQTENIPCSSPEKQKQTEKRWQSLNTTHLGALSPDPPGSSIQPSQVAFRVFLQSQVAGSSNLVCTASFVLRPYEVLGNKEKPSPPQSILCSCSMLSCFKWAFNLYLTSYQM